MTERRKSPRTDRKSLNVEETNLNSLHTPYMDSPYELSDNDEEETTPSKVNRESLAISPEMEPLQLSSSPDNGVSSDIEKTLYPQVLPSSSSTADAPWQVRLEEWLFPPHVPPECQLLRKENLAIPVSYLLIGLLQGLSSPLINVLPLDLHATEAQQTSISSIRGLPASLKLLFGFWSDNRPWCGYRRKPYMLLGWAMASISMYILLWSSNLDIPSQNNNNCFSNNDEDASDSTITSNLPADAPSIPFFSLSMLCF